MKVNPKSLKNEFNALFDIQESVEKDKNIAAKKRKYEHVELESKHNTNTLSEIFQDPDLLACISKDSHTLMRTRGVRASRIRDSSDIITSRKPQAKDVTTTRAVEQEVATLYDSMEKILGHGQEYVNPLAPKLRKYIARVEECEAISVSASAQPPQIAIQPNTVTVDMLGQDNAKDELTKMLDETSKVISASPLKTVGPRHLYSLLPRQTDINAFIYVKEDYNGSNRNEGHSSSTMDDTLITITIFNPKNPHAKFQEIEILSSQTLSNLRDAIYCQSDFTLNRDRKNQDPNEKIVNTTKTKLSPSIIYLDHVFYVDNRNDDDIPTDYYDKWIDAWLTKKQVNRQVHHYRKQSMESAILQDMSLELHKPFAFVHQNSCEHMMLIDDVRLISNNEYGSKSEFPRTTRNLRYDRFKCSMCSVYPATKITHDDIVSGFSPCYFCDICFESFHHDDTNVKVMEYSGAPGRETKSAKYLVHSESKRNK